MIKPEASYDTFSELDIRVGRREEAKPVKGSEKLLELLVDLGEDYGNVTILSGIAAWYTCEELVGKKTLFLANLAPRKMMGMTSQGMLIALNTSENEAKLVTIDQELAVGAYIC